MTPERRAEDILLGALGFGDDARIVEVRQDEDCFRGVGEWSDGERFDFQSDEPPTELERWALEILRSRKG